MDINSPLDSPRLLDEETRPQIVPQLCLKESAINYPCLQIEDSSVSVSGISNDTWNDCLAKITLCVMRRLRWFYVLDSILRLLANSVLSTGGARQLLRWRVNYRMKSLSIWRTSVKTATRPSGAE